MTPLLVVVGVFFALDNYASVMASRRNSGMDSPDAAADLRALAWKAIARAMRRFMLASLFGAVGWEFLTRPFLVPGSALDRGVTALGGGVLLFGSVLALYGASNLLTGLGFLRDGKRISDESQP